MKGALGYLLFTRLKNGVRDWVKKPARLIYVLLLAGCLGLSVASGRFSAREAERFRDIRELIAMAAGVYAVMFLLLTGSGFRNGAAMFSMADVNLLFTGPFPSGRLLFYGLLRQLGTSALTALFLLFQYGWIHGSYGISYGQLLLIVLGYVMTIFFGQILSMCLYAFCAADERRRTWTKVAFYGVYALFAAYAVFVWLKSGMQLEKLVEAFNGPVMTAMPVCGWGAGFAAGLMTGNVSAALLWLGVYLAGLILTVWLFSRTDQDFYEDVLKSAETAQTAITAQKQGVAGEVAPARVRVGKRGLESGEGAGVFFAKHRLENRRGRVLILPPMSLIFTAVTVLFTLFMHKTMEDGALIAALVMASYMQIFSVASGRLNRELLKPYIYMVPEPSFRKLVSALGSELLTRAAEAVLTMAIVGLIVRAAPQEIAACMLAHFSFSAVFVSVSVLESRLFGEGGSHMLMMLFYIGCAILFSLPGIAAAVAVSIFIGGAWGLTAGLAALSAINLAAAALVAFLCRDMLDNAELNNQ